MQCSDDSICVYNSTPSCAWVLYSLAMSCLFTNVVESSVGGCERGNSFKDLWNNLLCDIAVGLTLHGVACSAEFYIFSPVAVGSAGHFSCREVKISHTSDVCIEVHLLDTLYRVVRTSVSTSLDNLPGIPPATHTHTHSKWYELHYCNSTISKAMCR